MRRIINIILSIGVPIIIIAAAIYLYFKVDNYSPQVKLLIEYLPFGILMIGMLLSLSFNRSRIFYVLMVLLISLFSLIHTTNLLKVEFSYDTALYILLGVLIPLNILIFSILRERGFITLWGILKFIFITGQFASLVWLLMSPSHPAIDFIYREYIQIPFTINTPQTISFFMLICLVLLIAKGYFYNVYSDTGMLFSLIAIYISQYFRDEKGLLLLFSAAALILIITIIQDSYRMSYIDELTSLPGRRALKEDMLKLSGGYTIAMVDIDFFKKFNDKHGHDIGDEVLRMVAACLSQVTGGGKAFRYGGEEFTILFPGKELDTALPHLETLRETVSKRAFILRGKNRPKDKPSKVTKSSTTEKKLFVTISIGIAKKDKNTKSPQEVMKNADKALYRAKKKGRNCVSK